LARLQQEVVDLRRGPVPAPGPPAETPAAARAEDEDATDLFDHAAGGEAPEGQVPEGPQGDLPQARAIDGYGSLRVAVATDWDGSREVRNNSSRLGLRGTKPLVDGIEAFGRVELGVNLVANDRVILSGGDPGAPIGQGSQAVFSRLGFVGIDTALGSLAWGKQWSAYYDVAEFTDQFPLWSGVATGAFAAGTDGGVAGTGRAERALQYREARGPVSVALQMQSRASSPNDRSWVDVWGASAVVGRARGLSLGAAYNEVRDGVPDPTPNQSQLGDSDHPGDFRVRFGVGYLVYNFGAGSRVFLGLKLDDGRSSDGTKRSGSAFATGLNYTF
jgi:predicted porin